MIELFNALRKSHKKLTTIYLANVPTIQLKGYVQQYK